MFVERDTRLSRFFRPVADCYEHDLKSERSHLYGAEKGHDKTINKKNVFMSENLKRVRRT